MLESKGERAPAPSSVAAEWSPLKRGGTNFRTHRLVTRDSDTVVFKSTTGAKIFYLVFLAAGVIPLSIGLWQVRQHGFALRPEIIAPTSFGIVFCAMGWFLLRLGTRPIVFDRSRGYFWKGRKDPDAVWSKEELKHFCELKDVSGLQIVGELVSSDKGSFTSYELNLVLNDGSRQNVIDHGNERMLRQDAEQLAEFLGVQILKR